MAHELYEINGKSSMAFVGMTPWHGLGQSLNPDSDLDIWAREAMLEWTVEEADVEYQPTVSKMDKKQIDPDVAPHLWVMDSRKVLYRSDNGFPLSVVSNVYKPVQPREILEFFRSLIESHGFKMNTAGSLKNGKRIWALAETGWQGNVMGQDRIGCYLLLATSCDGSLSTVAQFTTIRVVCNNTLSLAYIGHSKRLKDEEESEGPADIVKVPHSAIFDPDQVKLDLGLTEDTFGTFLEEAGAMAEVKVTKDQAVEYFVKLLSKKEDDFDDIPERTFDKLWTVYRKGQGQDLKSTKDTVWGLVNGVTRFQDHERQAQSQDTRLDSSWFGNGNRMKKKAYHLAWDMVKKAA